MFAPLRKYATNKAVRELYPLRELVVCLEEVADGEVPENFWKRYDDSMRLADEKFVFLSTQSEERNMVETAEVLLKSIFGTSKIKIFSNLDDIKSELYTIPWQNKNLLLLRTDNGNVMNFEEIAGKILKLSV